MKWRALFLLISLLLPGNLFAAESPASIPSYKRKIAVVDARDLAPRDRKKDVYFSRLHRLGIAELLAIDLKKVEGLSVIDRDIVKEKLSKLGNRKNLEQASHILGMEAGADIVIQVQFVFLDRDYIDMALVSMDPREEKPRTLKKENGRRKDLFKILDRFVFAIAESTGHPVSEETRNRIEKGTAFSIEAWHRYTRGMEFYYQKTQNSLILAHEQFRQAELRDILFLPTYIAHARVYMLQAKNKWGPQKELYERAIESARKALFIDSKYLDGYEIIAEAYYLRGNYIETVRESLKAIRVNPGSLNCRFLLVKAHRALGKTEEADRELQKILELDPGNEEARLLLNARKS